MMCLITAFQLKAQTNAVWTQYPSFSNLNIGILSEDDTLHIRFSISTSTPEEEALQSKSVKMTLPAGVTIVGVSDGIGSMGGSIVPGKINSVGQEWQIPITSMSYNTEVYLKVTLSASDCNAMTGSSNVYIAVLSDETPVITAFATLIVVRPDIIAAPILENSPTLTDISQSFTYEITLGVSNGVSAQSMKITIAKDQFTTLSNIKLGTTPITPVETTPTSVVLDLTKDIVGATPISAANPRKLWFTARSTVRGVRKISATSVYPLENACITKNNLFNLTLSYATVSGSGTISHNPINRMETHPRTSVPLPSAEDGTTKFYVEAPRENTGDAPLYILNMATEVRGEGDWNGRGFGYISYLDTIYYKIGNGAVKAIDPSGYVYPDGYDLAASSPNYYKNLRNDNPFTLITPKKIRVEYRLPEVVPGKTKFIIYTPVRMGKIFDNAPWTENDPVRGVDVIGLATPLNRVNGVHQTLASMNNPSAPLSYDANGVEITTNEGFPDNGMWIRTSYFHSSIADMLIKTGNKGEVTIPFMVMNSEGNKYNSTFYIQTPEWLEIDSLSFGGTSTAINTVTKGKYFDSTRNTYYFNIKKQDGEAPLFVRYKPKPNGTGSDQYDYQNKNAVASIRYWVDWDLGYGKTGEAKNVNPVWDYFLKNIQQVTYFIKQEAITMNSMSLERQTRGLKVKGTSATLERTPVNGTTVAAVNDTIDHHAYLPGDIGHIKINAKVLGSDYKYLYLLVRSDSLNNRFDLALKNGSNALLAFVNVNKTTTIFADEIQQSGDSACIRFPYSGGTSFPNNATLDITLPFKAKTMGHPALFQVGAEAYVTKTQISNSLSPGTDRYGQEYLTEQWQITYAAASPGIFTSSSRSVTFADGTAKEYKTMLYDDGIEANGHAFPNEYRPYKFPARLEIDMPAGIRATQLKIGTSDNVDETSDGKDLIYPSPDNVSSNSDNTITTYTYDIASKVDFNISKYTGTYSSGKWIVPDDLYSILFYPTMHALPTAPNSGSIKMRLYFKDRLDNFATVTDAADSANISFVNNSLRSQLTVPNDMFTVYDYEVSVPSVIAGIESSTTHSGKRKAWLYIEGNVRNIRLQTKSGTPRTINAIDNGHWIQLDDLTVNTPADYTLNYTLNSMKTSGDSVRVYLIANFKGDTWTPTTSAPVVVNDETHFGGSKIIVTTPSTNSGIYGSFSSVPDTQVAYDKEYTIEISANQTGEAVLINPAITLTVPAGQVLQTAAGKCQYQDATGNWINILSDALSYASQNNSYTINSSAFNSAGDFVLYRQTSGKLCTLKIRLTFKPSCETPLTGFNYYVSFDGKNLLGDAVEGMVDVNSKRIDPLINTNYNFTTSIHLPNGTAFGGNRKRDTLMVTVNKYNGDTQDISPTDSLEIKLPRWLNITGKITMTCADLSELNGEVD
ncbi:MAG: hypothetical protein LBM08_10920, partial [Dysgonamonadaceae bacterium]|nr:hypothetical protein [Dysgonamonadaceae bacterium]